MTFDDKTKNDMDADSNAGGQKPHRWDGDGERCLDCGDKDWMASPTCSGPASVERLQKELESMTRMFHAACADLGQINEALGLDPDDGGAEPILDAIEELKRQVTALQTERESLVKKALEAAARKADEMAWHEGLCVNPDAVDIAEDIRSLSTSTILKGE